MTDNEIIKALEICKQYLNYDTHTYMAVKRGLDLINRQKEEIKRLKTEYAVEVKIDKEQVEEIVQEQFKDYELKINEVSTIAIKAFAKRLKDVFITIDGTFECSEIEEYIDNLVKEMTEGENG